MRQTWKATATPEPGPRVDFKGRPISTGAIMFGLFERPFSEYFQAEDRDGVTLVELSTSELRHPEQGRDFGADLRRLIAEHDRKDLVVDLGTVRYMGSTTLAVLLGVYRELQEKGGRLRLCRIHPDVQPGLNIAGVSKIVPCYPDVDSALAAS